MTLRDSFGYLWIATDKGVARYNGYEVKLFNIDEGLPTNDIWELDLDNRGRIWISGWMVNPGYIYKNRYHEVPFDNDRRITKIQQLASTNQGVAFIAAYKHDILPAIIRERDDVLDITPVASHPTLSTQRGDFLQVDDRSGYQTKLNVLDFNSSQMKVKRTCMCDSVFFDVRFFPPSYYSFHNFLILHYRMQGRFYAIDFTNCSVRTFLDDLRGDPGLTLPVTPGTSHLYVKGRDTIFIIDSTLRCIKKYPLSTLLTTQFANEPVNFFFEDRFWGNGVTTTNGVFFDRGNEYVFPLVKEAMHGYRHLGTAAGNKYWWNAQNRILVTNTTNSKIKLTEKSWLGVRQILPFNNRYAIVFGERTWLLEYATGATKFIHSVNRSQYITPDRPESSKWILYSGTGYTVKDAFIKKDTLYALSPTSFDVNFLRNDTLFVSILSPHRYSHIVHDSMSNTIIAVSPFRLFFHSIGGRNTSVVFPAQMEEQPEQLLIDNRTGNIFVKGSSTLRVFERRNFFRRQLLADHKLSAAKMRLYRGKLIIAGRAGITFLDPDNNYRQYAFLGNPKDKYYTEVIDLQVDSNGLILTTDKGVFNVEFPLRNSFVNNTAGNYRLILSYRDDQYVLQGNDSFYIDQDNRKLSFDLIRPSGTGTLRFMYRIQNVDTSWLSSASREINLPKLDPGEFHVLNFKMNDDVWNSRTRQIRIYIKPYWWQAGFGQAILFVTGIMGIVGLVTVVAFVTRYTINRKNEKTRRLLELELKSVYSQINPHFIFNSLNSALYLIKKEQTDKAYKHISKFSHLLRFYLKSSRNRYITLSEEITNLRNYIELQQIRFVNAFEYEIAVDPAVTSETIKIPSLLLQPIVENAINHGLLPKESGKLSITIKEGARRGSIRCVIEDDGIGRERSKANRNATQKESYGSDLINELITTFNRYEHTNITIEYIDKQLPDTGTIVIVNINNPRQYE